MRKWSSWENNEDFLEKITYKKHLQDKKKPAMMKVKEAVLWKKEAGCTNVLKESELTCCFSMACVLGEEIPTMLEK
jgi:hypothetical protein